MEKKMEQALWERCTAFHGHICPGLAIGFRAALCAAQLLELDFSQDEQTVCIAENDACGVDAIQVVLGCSVGKGNLLFHLRGKQAFSFYHRPSGRSVRLCLKPRPQGMTRVCRRPHPDPPAPAGQDLPLGGLQPLRGGHRGADGPPAGRPAPLPGLL